MNSPSDTLSLHRPRSLPTFRYIYTYITFLIRTYVRIFLSLYWISLLADTYQRIFQHSCWGSCRSWVVRHSLSWMITLNFSNFFNLLYCPATKASMIPHWPDATGNVNCRRNDCMRSIFAKWSMGLLPLWSSWLKVAWAKRLQHCASALHHCSPPRNCSHTQRQWTGSDPQSNNRVPERCMLSANHAVRSNVADCLMTSEFARERFNYMCFTFINLCIDIRLMDLLLVARYQSVCA